MRFYLTVVAALAACSSGTPSNNGKAVNSTVNVQPGAAPRAVAGPATLHGFRAQQIALIFQRMMNMGDRPTWAIAQATFPDVTWGGPRAEADALASNAVAEGRGLSGTINLAGVSYDVGMMGTRDQVDSVTLSGPQGDPVALAEIDRALASLGIRRELIGCSNRDFGYYWLRANGRSAVIEIFGFSQSRSAGARDQFSLVFDDPMPGLHPGKRDRSCL